MKRVGETLYYTFRLRRREDQTGIEKALTHPTADEYDDWVDYRRTQEEKKAAEKATVDRLTILQAIKEMDGTSEDHDVVDEDDWMTLEGESEHSMEVNSTEGGMDNAETNRGRGER